MVTGFLLTGIGERSSKGETNYCIVGESKVICRIFTHLETGEEEVVLAFKRFT